jgi:hypothetical protein
MAPYVDRAGLKFGSDQVYTGLSTDCFDSSKLTGFRHTSDHTVANVRAATF